MTTSLPLPPKTPSEFFIDTGLYREIGFGKDDDGAADAIFGCTGPIDAYCPGCNTHSIFTRAVNRDVLSEITDWLMKDRFDAMFICSRNSSHRMTFIIKVDRAKRTMQKIGQHPSLADLSMHDVQRYSGVLDNNTFRELTKAIGLAAHGVGIGSFVYLRRIFENLVEEAHQEAMTDVSWDEASYVKERMGEKIQMLKQHLPEFLVEHKVMYGILSKGIHELSEKECLDAFPVVKVGIEIILDAKLEEAARRKKHEAAKKSIQALAAGHDKSR